MFPFMVRYCWLHSPRFGGSIWVSTKSTRIWQTEVSDTITTKLQTSPICWKKGMNFKKLKECNFFLPICFSDTQCPKQTLGCEEFYCAAHTHPHFNNCFARTCAPHLNFWWSHPHPQSHIFLLHRSMVHTYFECSKIQQSK